ncbi:MAG: cytochrome c [Rhodospirillales bacterium]|tara:strand:- start:96 stop:500 length:405 start_codon:yes stop_codon:yes gene_type:complete
MTLSNTNLLAILFSTILLSGMSVSAIAAQKGIFENPVEPKMTPALNVGKMNYEAYCASCHGKTARGTDKGPTFISKIYHPGHHADGAFYLASRNGVRAHHWPFGNMPPIPEVNDQQIKMIIDYVRAIQKANDLF